MSSISFRLFFLVFLDWCCSCGTQNSELRIPICVEVTVCSMATGGKCKSEDGKRITRDPYFLAVVKDHTPGYLALAVYHVL